MAQKSKSSKVDQEIDQNLRRVYAEAANEAVPDRFAQLLDQLRNQERSDAPGSGGSEK